MPFKLNNIIKRVHKDNENACEKLRTMRLMVGVRVPIIVYKIWFVPVIGIHALL